jgi:hypothetical protein
MELEVQKAELAREILNTADESIIQDLWLFFHSRKPAVTVRKKRKLGILEGKATFRETGDGKITV